MNDISAMNIPLLNNVLKLQNENRSSNPSPMNDSIIKKYAPFIRDHPELLEKFSDISKDLIKMGFSPNLINNLFLIKRFQNLEDAVELLSLINGLWNHEYLEGDRFICFICDSPEHEHIKAKTLFQPQKTDPNIIRRMQSKLEKNVSVEKIVNSEEECIIKINVKDCPICFAEIDEKLKYTFKCQHEFCRDCIVNYVDEEINNARIEMKCPWKDCKEMINDEEIKAFASEKQISKLKKFRARREHSSDPNLVTCPIADCEGYARKYNLIEVTNSVSGRRSISKIKYTCSNHHNFCGKCNKVWHGNESCEDDKEILDYATDSGRMLKKCVKCKVWTEKNEGCNHMHCRICETDWCWLCEELCKPDHYRIANTPCYGRQFNEYDPDFEYYELLIDQTSFLKSLMFFFIFSFLIINGSIRNVLNPPGDRAAIQRPSKFVVWIILLCILAFILIFLVITNGIILIYMFLNLGKLQTVRNNFCKMLCVFAFLVTFLIFYPFGVTFACIWFTICMIYSVIKLIQL
jgi:hypothetical protein